MTKALQTLSIFADPSYVGRGYHAHMPTHAVRLSSRIRAEEMAQHLGVKLNPIDSYESDVCIWVKPNRFFDKVRDGDWIDFLDSDRRAEAWLKNHPKVGVIAASLASYDYLKANLSNKITLIPSHHINQERKVRERKEISVAGYIGSPSADTVSMYNEIAQKLKTIGFDFKTCFDYKSRNDAINFYMSIDLFVIGFWDYQGPHKIPTKIINAASFGIPTIAKPLLGYKELEGYYVHANNMEELLTEAMKFKNKDYYDKWSNKILKMADKYHISKIAKQYLNLPKATSMR